MARPGAPKEQRSPAVQLVTPPLPKKGVARRRGRSPQRPNIPLKAWGVGRMPRFRAHPLSIRLSRPSTWGEYIPGNRFCGKNFDTSPEKTPLSRAPRNARATRTRSATQGATSRPSCAFALLREPNEPLGSFRSSGRPYTDGTPVRPRIGSAEVSARPGLDHDDLRGRPVPRALVDGVTPRFQGGNHLSGELRLDA